MPYLHVEIDGREQGRYPIGAAPVVIGSGPSCDVRIDDPAVQPTHATLSPEFALREGRREALLVYRGRQVVEDILTVGESFTIGAAGRIRVRLLVGEEEAALGGGEELARRVRELENEKAALEQKIVRMDEQLARERIGRAGDRSAWTDQASRELLKRFFGDGLPGAAPAAGDRTPAEIVDRVAAAFAALVGFIARVERSTAHAIEAWDRGPGRGRSGAATPQDSLNGLLTRVCTEPDEGRSAERELGRYLDKVRKRSINAGLRAYRDGVERWAKTFLGSVSPRSIQIRGGISDRKLEFGMGYKTLWGAYCTRIHKYTPEVILAEIDDVAASTLGKEPTRRP